ncbi:MAG: response regulator [Chloroflexi bacterium]|nr:response regulator [Chloroflexota bacterium]
MASQEKINVVVIDDIDESREMILRMLQFDSTIEVVGIGKTGLEAIDIAQKLKPDVIVMDINMPDMDGITATETIRKKIPHIQIVILSVQNDANYMRKAMLAGARDFLTKPPMIDELTAAIRRAGDLAHEEKSKNASVYSTTGVTGSLIPGMMLRMPVRLGKVICVYSPKGGTGCTTIASNLAVALKTQDNKVAIIDANLLFGNAAVFFNEHGKNSVLDLVDRVNDLDSEIVEDVMVENKLTGLHIMASPKDPELVDSHKGEAIAKVINFMRQLYSYIVIDTTPYLTEIVQTCLDVADLTILITTQDIPSIKNANQFLSLADASGISRDKILFVMNRYDKRIAISPERVGESLKQPLVAAIPFEERIVTSAMNRGVPFMTDNKLAPAAKSMITLTEAIYSFVQKEQEITS